MQYLTFVIKDNAIAAYLRPFYAVAAGQAARSFTDEINNPQGEMWRHPEDYDLYELGTWSDHDAQHTNLPNGPRLILRGKDAKRNSASE